jgi:para-nitrobenzyl esterase
MRRSCSFLGLALMLTLGMISFRKSVNSLELIKTDAGQISGVINATGDVYAFKGIPFAAPPVGDLRWKEPQPVKPWEGVRKCESFGPSPMQAKPVPFSMWSEEFLIPKEPISEDCLYLNVWTAAKSTGEKRPVIVWIYGGGFLSGGSAVPIYDGEAMAKKGIVFVSINYRVGVFGFFAHPELTKESGRNASGNYAILDQLAALEWVKRNIAVFGGDPGNVTIAGQSAGSISVSILVASPLGKHLFQKAIGESGASFSNPFTTLAKAEEAGEAFGKSLNAPSLADLRKVSAEDLMKKNYSIWGAIVDGYVLPGSIASIFTAGKENKVPLLTGWNQEEFKFFGTVKNAAEFKKEMNDKYGSDAQAALENYPANDDSGAMVSQYRMSSDQVFGTQNFIWANMQSNQGAKVYVYRFTHKVPGTGEYAKYGAFHGGELAYAYNNLQFVNRPWQTADHKLAAAMSSYWANFAAKGNPNGKGLPEWKPYNSNTNDIMILNEQCYSVKMPDLKAIEFLASKMGPK